MFEDWKCPDWGEPWEPQIEIDWAKKIATQIYESNPDLSFRLDTETEGCLYVELWRGEMLIGTLTLSALRANSPLVSMFLGAEEDEFHVSNLDVLSGLPKFYMTEYVYPEDDNLPGTQVEAKS